MLSEAGQRVFDARYAGRDEEGNINETFEQAVNRLLDAVYPDQKDDDIYHRTYDALINLELIPSTPIWANVGKADRPWQPGACFVLDVEDSLDDMYRTLHQTAMVFKSGGGVGYNFSKIRPKGSLVRSTKGQASGVVELIRLYDASSNMVMQGGVRRGASMGILNVDHPEIMDFINCKRDGSLTNFNISVGITDNFMKAVETDGTWELMFDGKVHEAINARELWQSIAKAAHECGDPGIIFLDRLSENNPVPTKPITATNPCGEQPLYYDESCLLASVNLARMVDSNGELLVNKFDETVRLGVRFLDSLIDVAEYPLPQIEEATKASRRIGLGYTGLQDLLIRKGLPYSSPDARHVAQDITLRMLTIAGSESSILAQERGCFPDWEDSTYYPDRPMRNASLVTIAPTGSVTAMAGCEGYGIEPIFAVAYSKATEVAGDFHVFSPLFLEKTNLPQEVLDEVGRKGSCKDVEGVPLDIQRLFRGAQEISYTDHILMQAAVQRGVDNAVSKTINMHNSATVEDVLDAYALAYEEGLKGITVYRDGCKEGVISVGEGSQVESTELARGEVIPRPVATTGTTHRLDTGCGKLYLTANMDDEGNLIETFLTTGSDGGCLIFTEATSRLISLAIRGGIDVEEVIEQLQGTHACPAYVRARALGKGVSKGKSCASAIANKLKEVTEAVSPKLHASVERRAVCPECGAATIKSEGCVVCSNCGYSKC